MKTVNENGVKLPAPLRIISRLKVAGLLGIMAAAAVVLFLLSFTMGQFHIGLSEVASVILSKIFGLKAFWPQSVELVIFHIRMPRIIAAVVIGGVLALSGTTFQGIFNNPLVAPDILGASAGAAFGAALGIFLRAGNFSTQILAFVFGIAAVMLTFFISRVAGKGANVTLILILAGMVISDFFTAFVSLIQYLADPANLLQQAIAFWLMGGLSTLSMNDVLIAMIPMILGSAALYILRWRLNILSFGDDEANSMGIDAGKTRLAMLCCTTLITSASVAVGGIIGWVGLIVPNIVRIVFGANFKTLVPASILLGIIFLLLADDAARTLFSLDIPIGILTALIGGPIFALVLVRERDRIS